MALVCELSRLILDSLCDYVNLEYLRTLQEQLMQVRLLYEAGKIRKGDYKKLEAELTERIKILSTQLKTAPKRVHDIRLL